MDRSVAIFWPQKVDHGWALRNPAGGSALSAVALGCDVGIAPVRERVQTISLQERTVTDSFERFVCHRSPPWICLQNRKFTYEEPNVQQNNYGVCSWA